MKHMCSRNVTSFMIFTLLLSSQFAASTQGGQNADKHIFLLIDEHILYVGGSGPGNYSHIQDALDDTMDGDTVFVYGGTYVETITIYQTVTLQGEDKNTTIIDGNLSGDVISVYAERVNITNLTIKNGGPNEGDSGIKLHSNNNTVNNNIISDNGKARYCYTQGGLYLNQSSYNYITNNIITENKEAGIYLLQSHYNMLYKNTIHDNSGIALISNASSYNIFIDNDIYENYCGMSFWPYSTYNSLIGNHIYNHPGCGMAFKAYSNNNIILYNTITNNLEWGVMLGWGPTTNNVVERNTISGAIGGDANWFDGSGIVLSSAYFNSIKYNNFINNKHDVHLENSVFNHFTQNYWANHSGSGMKIIKGSLCWPVLPDEPRISIPWFTMDMKPVHTLYEPVPWYIVGMSTSKGPMALELYEDKLPITTQNFVRLSQDGFYDGIVFHRVIDDFVIQGGGYYPNGTYKRSPYGPIVLETNPEVTHVDGAISMARTSNPNSATSQFFICDGAQHRLDGNYSAFGQTIGGLEVLRSIASVETATRYGMQDWPIDDVIIQHIVVTTLQ